MKIVEELGADDLAASRARRLIRGRLGDRVTPGSLADVLTIVTELVANAVAYGEGPTLGFCLELRFKRLKGSVTNRGRGTVQLATITPTSNRGLGLHMVDAIADDWRVVQADGRTTVAFELALN